MQVSRHHQRCPQDALGLAGAFPKAPSSHRYSYMSCFPQLDLAAGLSLDRKDFFGFKILDCVTQKSVPSLALVQNGAPLKLAFASVLQLLTMRREE